MPEFDAHAAHVQVLTAEVRTLVVGSRQVTMSVFEQLDSVQPSDIEPFGRINPKRGSSYPYAYAYVVGRHLATGSLVRSHVPRRPETVDERGWLPNGEGANTRYAHWRNTDPEEQRQRLADVGKQWSALPLIVLAGLR